MTSPVPKAQLRREFGSPTVNMFRNPHARARFYVDLTKVEDGGTASSDGFELRNVDASPELNGGGGGGGGASGKAKPATAKSSNVLKSPVAAIAQVGRDVVLTGSGGGGGDPELGLVDSDPRPRALGSRDHRLPPASYHHYATTDRTFAPKPTADEAGFAPSERAPSSLIPPRQQQQQQEQQQQKQEQDPMRPSIFEPIRAIICGDSRPPKPLTPSTTDGLDSSDSRASIGRGLVSRPTLSTTSEDASYLPPTARQSRRDTAAQARLQSQDPELLHHITPPSSSRFGSAGRNSPGSEIMARPSLRKSTPKKVDWTFEKIADALEDRSQDLRRFHQDLIAFTLTSVEPTERRVQSGADWFANVKHEPVAADEPKTDDMLKVKVKHHTRGRKDHSSFHFRPILLKTDKPRVPKYRFHHKEIARNVLTPNTMLKFVPVIRDLNPGEDAQYNTWLKELDRMDASCGFKPMGSREHRVIHTTRQERAAMLALYLDSWLDELAIQNCNRSTLIRQMVRSESDQEMTPHQKSILDNLHSDNQPTTPRAVKTARTFTEAFDHVFANMNLPPERRVTLRDVLLLDRTVDDVVESKKTAKGTSQDVAEQQSWEDLIDTYAIMGCLVCFSNSCEHGDYGQNNEKRNFSLDCNGRLEQLFLKDPAADAKPDHDGTQLEPCDRECYRIFGTAPHADTRSAAPWSKNEDNNLTSLYAGIECSKKVKFGAQCLAAKILDRKCWEVQRRLDELKITLPVDTSTPLPRARTLPWYDRFRKVLMGDWQAETTTHDHKLRVINDPCHHEGRCTKENCECVRNDVMCERFCRCTAECCSYKFTGCACSSTGKTCLQRQKEGKPCICVQLNRECDPLLCRGCGVEERAQPGNRHNDALMETGCQNCALQRGGSKAVAAGQSQLEGCGYGLFALEDIAQHEFVIEYTGELIMHDEGVRREARRGEAFDDEGSVTSYVFSLLDSEGIWVDAAIYGNHSRYINHEVDDYNVEPKILYVNGEYRIRFTATRNIQAGDELFFNYGGSFPNLTKKMIKDKTEQSETPAGDDDQPKKTKSRGPAGKAAAKGTKRGQTVRKEAPKPPAEGLDDIVSFQTDVPKKTRKRRRIIEEEGEDEAEEEEYQPSMEESEAKNGERKGADQRGRRRVRRRLHSPSDTLNSQEEGGAANTIDHGPKAANGKKQQISDTITAQNDADSSDQQARRRGRAAKHETFVLQDSPSPEGPPRKRSEWQGTPPARNSANGFASRQRRGNNYTVGEFVLDSEDGDSVMAEVPATPTPHSTGGRFGRRRARVVASDSDDEVLRPGGVSDGSDNNDESPSSQHDATRSDSRSRRERRKPRRYREADGA